MVFCATFLFLLGLSAVAGDNVILIIVDDLGLDHLKLYGLRDADTFAPTPNIDKLAANGLVFERAYSYPVCTATRTSILTGRFGFRTGVGCVRGGPKSTEFTLAKALQSAQISNACIGKWHIHTEENGGSFSPNKMGFDHYSGLLDNTDDYFNWEKTVNGISSKSTLYLTTEFTNDAVEWVEDQGEEDFFLWLAHFAVHSPFHTPPDSLHSFGDTIEQARGMRKNRVMYKAMLESLDTEIGRLMASMSPAVLAKTNFILIGDNGGPERVGEGPYAPGNRKGSIYQGGINIPFIVSGPGVAPKGKKTDAMVHTVDLFDTILEMLGLSPASLLPPEVKVDSRSFSSVLKGESGGREYNYAESFGCPGGGQRRRNVAKEGQVIRNGRYKLIIFSDGAGEELYDLNLDPFEGKNLLKAGPLSENVASAMEELKASLKEFIV